MASLHSFNTSNGGPKSSKILVKDLNKHITCYLCKGYLVDATVIIDCYHYFCRSCIVQHLMQKFICPVPDCKVILYTTDTNKYLNSDRQLQGLINKLVPNLFADEQKRRVDFYKSKGLPNPECLLQNSELSNETPDVPQPNGDSASPLEFADNMYLELLPINEETPIVENKYFQVPSMAPISTLQKLVKQKFPDQNVEVNFYFKNEILGKDHTFKFIVLTRYSGYKNEHLPLHYKIDNHSNIAAIKQEDDAQLPLPPENNDDIIVLE